MNQESHSMRLGMSYIMRLSSDGSPGMRQGTCDGGKLRNMVTEDGKSKVEVSRKVVRRSHDNSLWCESFYESP